MMVVTAKDDPMAVDDKSWEAEVIGPWKAMSDRCIVL